MRLHAWRIVKEKYASTAFSGEGASMTGGRWNSRGVWVVYTSGTQSLAALETLVHLNPPIMFRYVVLRIEFDESMVETIAPAALPGNWREEPVPSATQTVGDQWVQRGHRAILALPSTIIPDEPNYLLNPLHPDFHKIAIGPARPFAFDPRLVRG